MIWLLIMALTFGQVPQINDVGTSDYPESEIVLETIVEAPKFTEEEIELLRAITWAEAGNEGPRGQQAVANVIINRVDSEYFPNTLHEVVYQGKGRQFNGVWRDNFGYYTEETVRAVDEAINDPIFDKDVVYFSNLDLAKDRAFIDEYIVPYTVSVINKHYFARDKRGY